MIHTIAGQDISYFLSIPVLSEAELLDVVDKQTKFLLALFPFLGENVWHPGAIELRALKRVQELRYLRSLNLWRILDKDKDELFKFLQKGINGNAYCFYYSAYVFDNSVKIEGKHKGITNANALYTTILAADFDDMLYDEFKSIQEVFRKLGIESIDVFTGHGYQSIVLLSEEISDTQLLKKWTELLLKKGFHVDAKIVDSARIFRMPYSYNCKAYDIRNKHYSETPMVIETSVISWTEKRYSLADVFARINSLPDTVSSSDVSVQMSLYTEKHVENFASETRNKLSKEAISEKCEFPIIEVSLLKEESIKRDYPLLPFDKLPPAIVNMLYCTPGGMRNSVLLYLILFFKNKLGLSVGQVNEVLVSWGQNCKPSLANEFIVAEVNRLLRYGYKGERGSYTVDMAKQFGSINLEQYSKKDRITILNSVFECFSKVSDASFRIYISLLFDRTKNGQRNYSFSTICQIAGIAERTFYKHIKYLTSSGYLNKRRANKKTGSSYEYYLNPFSGKTDSFTAIDNTTVEMMLQKLTDSEMVLFCFLTSLVSLRNFMASQTYIANKIGKSHNRVSELTRKLMDKGFIEKQTGKRGTTMYCIYKIIL